MLLLLFFKYRLDDTEIIPDSHFLEVCVCVCWEGALVVRGASGNTIVTFVVQYRRIVERSGEKEDVVGCR